MQCVFKHLLKGSRKPLIHNEADQEAYIIKAVFSIVVNMYKAQLSAHYIFFILFKHERDLRGGCYHYSHFIKNKLKQRATKKS